MDLIISERDVGYAGFIRTLKDRIALEADGQSQNTSASASSSSSAAASASNPK